jgi:DNA-directed RNA polymerase subunit RPC12/RpoP
LEFFRHCPDCGRRFHIKLESKKLVHLERNTVVDERVPRRTVGQFRGSPVLLVQEGRPIIADIEEFQYTYKCNHCGHEWSEKHVEEHRED